MSEVDNKALVRRYYEEVLNQQQLHIFDELANPSFVSYLADGNSITLDIYEQAIAVSLTVIPDLKVTVEDQIAEDDKVVTCWKVTGTPQVELLASSPMASR